MKVSNLLFEKSYPEIKVGDEILFGKFKNKKATVKGFGTNPKTGQPTLLTSKGEMDIYKVRISKLLPKNS